MSAKNEKDDSNIVKELCVNLTVEIKPKQNEKVNKKKPSILTQIYFDDLDKTYLDDLRFHSMQYPKMNMKERFRNLRYEYIMNDIETYSLLVQYYYYYYNCIIFELKKNNNNFNLSDNENVNKLLIESKNIEIIETFYKISDNLKKQIQSDNVYLMKLIFNINNENGNNDIRKKNPVTFNDLIDKSDIIYDISYNTLLENLPKGDYVVDNILTTNKESWEPFKGNYDEFYEPPQYDNPFHVDNFQIIEKKLGPKNERELDSLLNIAEKNLKELKDYLNSIWNMISNLNDDPSFESKKEEIERKLFKDINFQEDIANLWQTRDYLCDQLKQNFLLTDPKSFDFLQIILQTYNPPKDTLTFKNIYYVLQNEKVNDSLIALYKLNDDLYEVDKSIKYLALGNGVKDAIHYISNDDKNKNSYIVINNNDYENYHFIKFPKPVILFNAETFKFEQNSVSKEDFNKVLFSNPSSFIDQKVTVQSPMERVLYIQLEINLNNDNNDEKINNYFGYDIEKYTEEYIKNNTFMEKYMDMDRKVRYFTYLYLKVFPDWVYHQNGNNTNQTDYATCKNKLYIMIILPTTLISSIYFKNITYGKKLDKPLKVQNNIIHFLETETETNNQWNNYVKNFKNYIKELFKINDDEKDITFNFYYYELQYILDKFKTFVMTKDELKKFIIPKNKEKQKPPLFDKTIFSTVETENCEIQSENFNSTEIGEQCKGEDNIPYLIYNKKTKKFKNCCRSLKKLHKDFSNNITKEQYLLEYNKIRNEAYLKLIKIMNKIINDNKYLNDQLKKWRKYKIEKIIYERVTDTFQNYKNVTELLSSSISTCSTKPFHEEENGCLNLHEILNNIQNYEESRKKLYIELINTIDNTKQYYYYDNPSEMSNLKYFWVFVKNWTYTVAMFVRKNLIRLMFFTIFYLTGNLGTSFTAAIHTFSNSTVTAEDSQISLPIKLFILFKSFTYTLWCNSLENKYSIMKPTYIYKIISTTFGIVMKILNIFGVIPFIQNKLMNLMGSISNSKELVSKIIRKIVPQLMVDHNYDWIDYVKKKFQITIDDNDKKSLQEEFMKLINKSETNINTEELLEIIGKLNNSEEINVEKMTDNRIKNNEEEIKKLEEEKQKLENSKYENSLSVRIFKYITKLLFPNVTITNLMTFGLYHYFRNSGLGFIITILEWLSYGICWIMEKLSSVTEKSLNIVGFLGNWISSSIYSLLPALNIGESMPLTLYSNVDEFMSPLLTFISNVSAAYLGNTVVISGAGSQVAALAGGTLGLAASTIPYILGAGGLAFILSYVMNPDQVPQYNSYFDLNENKHYKDFQYPMETLNEFMKSNIHFANLK